MLRPLGVAQLMVRTALAYRRRELPLGKAEAGPRTLGVRATYLRPLGLRFSPAA